MIVKEFNEKVEMMHHQDQGGKHFMRGPHDHGEKQCLTNDIKLFTDKSKMVEYVNQLQGIENVDIYKIEDNLYKVLVSRKKEHHGCHHHEDQEK